MDSRELALREELQTITTRQRAINEKCKAEKRGYTADEEIEYKNSSERKHEIRKELEVFVKDEHLTADENELRASMGTVIPPESDEKGGENRQAGRGKNELRSAFVEYLRNGEGSRAAEEYRALQQDVATQAGYLVAEEQFVAEVIQEMYNQVFIRKISKTYTLSKAQSMGVPKKTTDISTFAMGSEIGTPSADSSLAFGKRQFIPRDASGYILVSNKLLRNSAINVDQYVRGELAEHMGAFQEGKFMTGTGAGEPLGIFTASDDGIGTARDVTTGNTATNITAENLKAVKYHLKAQYRNRAKWLFHRDGIEQLDSLVDGNGRFLWKDSMVEGEPSRLLGMPVIESENAPNTFTASQYVGILGDFNYYWIVDALNWELRVLNELYAMTNQACFLVRFEFDAAPVIANAFARVKLGS